MQIDALPLESADATKREFRVSALPLVNFALLIILTVERTSRELFVELSSRYQHHLQVDPALPEVLTLSSCTMLTCGSDDAADRAGILSPGQRTAGCRCKSICGSPAEPTRRRRCLVVEFATAGASAATAAASTDTERSGAVVDSR